ncbi:unnamed protein product [Closterium sp. Yama58-4]|nr:unnamed protein product [Closterium sp. Yama58-4]
MASSLIAHQSLAALSFSTAVKGASLSANRLAAAPTIAPRGLSVSALLGFNKAAVPTKTAPVKKQLRTETASLLSHCFFIAFTVLGAISGLGERGRFVDDDAPAGPPVKPGSFKAALGLSESGPLFGFTKANELFVGRVAQLGFAASMIGEVITGRGALAQLNIDIGLLVWELEPLLFASISFFVAAINLGTVKFINDER